MKIVVIGASGSIGRVVSDTLESRGHEVIRASRTGEVRVDLADAASIAALFVEVNDIDAVVVAAGSVPFKHLTELDRDDYTAAFLGKTLPQIEVVRQAITHLRDGGSVTLTSGVLSRDPIATGAAAAMANGALESFVITAAAEAPRGIRINTVSPDVLENSPGYHRLFAGHRPVGDDEIGRAYTLAVEGLETGRTITV
ncbi:short chain dehydrogenase [Microbacterium galbinum]|uniref:short chain dehydrogenase n=1 Tax=Microbacterium galbinum TaxID=2851646 RepID=UPI001FFD9E9E|nr:short chain dehydrogenase [Microbacterium galbinum]MCK2029982.1 short chain dehydrogenase [Microbacterium galbinum]